MIDFAPFMKVANACATPAFLVLGTLLLLVPAEVMLPIYVRKRKAIGLLILVSAAARVGDLVGDHVVSDAARIFTSVLGTLTAGMAALRVWRACHARRS